MGSHEFSYRFNAIGIDISDVNEVRKYNSVLSSVHCLDEQFDKLESSYKNATKERADIIINVLPDISGVAELSVYHKIDFKLFSRTVKRNCFSLCISKYNNDTLSLYFYNTDNFVEVKQIFVDFIEHKTVPDLSDWECKFIG